MRKRDRDRERERERNIKRGREGEEKITEKTHSLNDEHWKWQRKETDHYKKWMNGKRPKIKEEEGELLRPFSIVVDGPDSHTWDLRNRQSNRGLILKADFVGAQCSYSRPS